MAYSDSVATNSLFCAKLEDSIEVEEEERIEDYDKLLGKVLKEGTINAQDNDEEWVECHIVIREQGVILSREKRKGIQKMDFVMHFSSAQEVGIVILPDNARRSRESKLFPFAVHKKTAIEDMHIEPMKIKEGTVGGKPQGMNRDEVILATSNGREMWEWASCIRWLGNPPKEEEVPLFLEASTINNHSVYYEDAGVLQNVLLDMFTYKNLPQNPISFEQLARFNRKRGGYVLKYINYPTDFFPEDMLVDNTENPFNEDNEGLSNEVEDGVIETLLVDHSLIIEKDLCSEIEDGVTEPPLVDQIPIIENHAHTFGLFAYIVLVGACVHVNEKCFELITSSNLYDISSQVVWKGNSPLSMLCEGDFKSSRHCMVQALLRQGYPKLEGYYANYSTDRAFSIFVAKPHHLWGIGNVRGKPVHPDDQKLCRYLRDEGDGRNANECLSNQLIEASLEKSTNFESHHNGLITAVVISKSIMNWGSTTLTKLNLSRNGIFELPEELYTFTRLTHLDVSYNCLFGLSHKLGNLINLTHFDIHNNLIEELPYTIENLTQIRDFTCSSNPITKPPSAVWSTGISNVRNFFKDMRESGTEINVDLRVLVLGLSEAGKTSLINGLINPAATVLTRIGDRTVGIEKRTWIMKRNENERPVNLLTYDFAGQEEYYITHHLFLGSKAFYIIAFDLSKYEPRLLNKQIMLWWNSIQDRVCDVKSNDSKTPKVILVGTHADMLDNAQNTADDIHKSLIEHFRSRMEYLNDRHEKLEKELEKLDPRRSEELKNKDAATQKKDTYKMLPASKKAQILSRESEIKKILHEQQCTIALPAVIHAVSSKNMHNFDALKEQIKHSLTETGPSGKYFPHLDAPLPGSWFQVRRFVRQQSTLKGNECMKLPKYFKLLSDELDISMDVGRRATKFCHDLGDVLLFEKEDLIFLQPSFLIDTFKYVIRHDHKESTYWTEKMLDRNISEEKFNKGKDLLLKKGELEPWLLEVLWSRLYDDLEDSSIMNNLIQLLETFDIGTFIDHNGFKFLSIPEFQPKILTMSWPKLQDDGVYEIQRWISVDQNLPHGLLKRIQVRIFKKVFKRSNAKEFNLSQHEIYILNEHSTEIYCMSGKRTEECPGSGTSEGVRLYIRGTDKQDVMSLLSKIYACIKVTLNEYPGLMFDHYVVHTTNHGLSFVKLEEVQALQADGESKMCVPINIQRESNELEDEQDKHNAYQYRTLNAKSRKVILDINDLLAPSQLRVL